ncbi:carboxypeptidase-like regulatory domain-containing protein [Planctomycetes bacterium K23_9]|uniref:Bacterial Ig-like domain (Group 1) n=1 Tax=Stieleria marina TaxID=1930275 RepID=A0A517NWS1_9BACT|nr:Bacterial Ig-like domain (group 1) [Planctomycetes bacterium K23_9]
MSVLRLFFATTLLSIGFNGIPHSGLGQEKKPERAITRIPLSGTLTDENGDPVVDAKITIRGEESYQRAITDPNGRYEFVEIDKPGEFRISIESTGHVGVTDYASMPKVMLMANKAITKDFVLKRAGQLHVTVKDTDGKPIKGVRLYCRSVVDARRIRVNKSTNAAGVATVSGLEPLQTNYIIGAMGKSHSIEQALVKVTDPDEVAKLEIILHSGRTIKGKLLCSDGKPAAGWALRALPSWWKFNSYPRGVPIAEDGSFELIHITNQPYNLSVSIPKGGTISMSRNIMADANLTDIQQPLQLTVDHPSPSSMNYLKGKIRWIGKPLERGIRLSGYSAQTQHHIHESIDSKTTEFKVGPVPPGVYRIRPENPELEVMNLRKIKNLDDLDSVKIPNDEPLQIVLRVRGKPHVQGIVTDAETKKPIKTFQYRITKLRTLEGPNYVQDDDWKVGSSDAGDFQSEVVGPGIYTVSVVADGYAVAKSEQVDTIKEIDRELKIELQRGIAFKGMVVDEAGEPIENAIVRALSLASGAMPRVASRFVTDMHAQHTKAGKFSFDNLLDTETFRVDHPDYAFREISGVQIVKDAPESKITLSKGATVYGRVYDQNGDPQIGETLHFQDASGYGGGDREAGRFGIATTDRNGEYKIQHLPATTIYVSRAEEWSAMGVVRHVIITEANKEHRLDFGGKANLSGRLIANDEPQENVKLQLGGPDSTFGGMKMFARTGDDGHFTFHGAPPGDWYLYREIVGSRGDWSLLDRVAVPANGSVELGDRSIRIARMTILPKLETGEIPDELVLRLQQYNEELFFGRDAAKFIPRATQDAPFAFDMVSSGTYDLICYGLGDFGMRQKIVISDDEIDQPIALEIPAATASLTTTAKGSNGESLRTTMSLRSQDGRIHAMLSPNTVDVKNPYPTLQLPPGKYTVTNGPSFNRRESAIADVELVAGEEQQLEISFGKLKQSTLRRATVRVCDKQGVLIPCRIEVLGAGSEDVLVRTRLPTMTLSGPAGDYRIRIKLSGFEPIEVPLRLKSLVLQKSNDNKIELKLKRIDQQIGD